MRHTLLAAILLAASFGAHAQTGIFGIWVEPTGSSIEVTHCDADVCLRLVAISPKAPTSIDERNPNTALRQRSLCGLQIGSGFHLADGSNKAEGGSLYDPKSGKTYRGSMTRVGDTLRLRGYVGIKMFGVTETWTRAPGIPSRCTR